MARVVRITSGVGLVILGIALLVLPGPGIITIVAGLALLAKDVPAIGRLEAWVKQKFLPSEASSAPESTEQSAD